MLKEKLHHLWRGLAEGFIRTVRLHPVELGLLLFACAGCAAMYESDSDFTDPWGLRVALVPFFLMFALTINQLAGQGLWRKVYWVCWLPIVPLLFWDGLASLVTSQPFLITSGVLAPLAVLMSRREADNTRFVSDAVVYLRAGVVGGFFACVVCGLFGAILYSTVYIFNIEGEWIGRMWVYAIILCGVFGAPLLMLIMADRRLGRVIRGTKFFEVLLNYLLSPALLIYMAILYLYIIKIVITWSLPLGGVAYLVFGFMIFALLVKALQEILTKNPFEWFFHRFSLFALPPLVLFWVGVMRRVGEYGLTTSRVWLVICGVVMTSCLLLLLNKRTGRYLYLSAAIFTCFALTVCIPCLHPEQIAISSQTNRARQTAERLGVLADDGRLALKPLTDADSVYMKDYRILYEALAYINSVDCIALQRFGLEDLGAFEIQIPVQFMPYVMFGEDVLLTRQRDIGVEAPKSRAIPVCGYKTLYTNVFLCAENDEVYYDLDNDTLRINFAGKHPPFAIAGTDLLRRQLQKVGVDESILYDSDQLRPYADAFLTYTDDRMMILFSSIYFCNSDEGLEIQVFFVDAVLIR